MRTKWQGGALSGRHATIFDMRKKLRMSALLSRRIPV
jgi:hypothetical protein